MTFPKRRGKTVNVREAIRLLSRRLGKSYQNGEWVNYNCPFRHEKNGVNKPDTKKRLGINLKTGWFNCHRCGRKGLVASEFGVNIEGAIPTAGRREARVVEREEGFKRPFKTLPLPPEVSALARSVVRYLGRRGVDHLTAHVLDIGYGTKSPWIGASIHPYYKDDNETLVGWQARYTEPGTGPKVRTSREGDLPESWGASDGALYLLETVYADNPLLVVEGPYDALSASRVMPAVACLGSVLHPAQAHRLRRRRAGGIIVGFDWDKASAARRACKTLLRAGCEDVSIIVWPKDWDGRDWGDLSTEGVKLALGYAKKYGVGCGL